MPCNALPADEVEEVKMFIQTYATVNGFPQPAAPRGHNKKAPTYLPCVTTKKQVHAEYSKAGGKVAYNTFSKQCSKECREIVIMLPKEDVCGTCADLQALISRSRTVETRLKHADALKSSYRYGDPSPRYLPSMHRRCEAVQRRLYRRPDTKISAHYFWFRPTGLYPSPFQRSQCTLFQGTAADSNFRCCWGSHPQANQLLGGWKRDNRSKWKQISRPEFSTVYVALLRFSQFSL